MSDKNKIVFDFEEIGLSQINLVGSKGAHLGEIVNMGLPVPPGFTISTKALQLVLDGDYHKIQGEVHEAISRLEEKSGKRFGDVKKPLLVSVRSGAVVSMPGMMETILNVGLNSKVMKKNKKDFLFDCYDVLLRSFATHVYNLSGFQQGESVFVNYIEPLDSISRIKKVKEYFQQYGIVFPKSAEEQLELAVRAVFRSWNSPRAKGYRAMEKIPEDIGTAVNVQQMVFGNFNKKSLTATFFTRDPCTGKNEFFGNFIRNAQGESIVNGDESKPISELEPKLREKLKSFGEVLEEKFGNVQEVEVTVEKGVPYILQTREAKRTSRANIRILLDYLEEGKISEKEALMSIDSKSLRSLERKIISPEEKYSPAGSGTISSTGIVCGHVAYGTTGIKELSEEGKIPVLIRKKLETDLVDKMDSVGGIITRDGDGNSVSHAIVVARGKNKPCITGVCGLDWDNYSCRWSLNGSIIGRGSKITLDADKGEIILKHLKLVEPEPSEEIEELLGILDKYKTGSLLRLCRNLKEIRRAGEKSGVIYVPGFFSNQGRGLVRAIMGDEGKIADFEERIFKNCSKVLGSENNKASPFVLGLFSVNDLRSFLVNGPRLRFRSCLLSDASKAQEKIKQKECINVGKRVVWGGYEAFVRKICEDCGEGGGGIQLEYGSGGTFCITKKEMKAHNLGKLEGMSRIAGVDNKIKGVKSVLKKIKKADPGKVYDAQVSAVKRAIEQTGRKDVKVRNYSFTEQGPMVLGGIKYEVVDSRDYHIKKLLQVQGLLKDG